MANKKITDFTTITTPANNDLVELVDVSDTTDSALGSSKNATIANVITKGHGLADGIVKTSGGVLTPAVAGTDYYNPGGTDVAVADGGTGASSAAGARTNLGLVIGTDVQAYGPTLNSLEGLSLAQGDLLYATGADTLARLPKGSASQILQMNSGATAPEWTSPAAGGTGDMVQAETFHIFQADGTNSGPVVFSFPVSTDGTASNVTPATNFPANSFPQVAYTTSTSTGQSCGLRQNFLRYHRGQTAFNNVSGGFTAYFRWVIRTGSANCRWFVGFYGSTSAIGNVEPSTIVNMFGIGADSTDTNLQIMSNDGSGTATKSSLGSNFPRTDYGLFYHYEMTLTVPAAGSTFDYSIKKYTDSNTTFTASGTISSDLPSQSQLLAPVLWLNNNSNATAVSLGVSKVHIKSRLS